jgi:hypothetical protein
MIFVLLLHLIPLNALFWWLDFAKPIEDVFSLDLNQDGFPDWWCRPTSSNETCLFDSSQLVDGGWAWTKFFASTASGGNPTYDNLDTNPPWLFQQSLNHSIAMKLSVNVTTSNPISYWSNIMYSNDHVIGSSTGSGLRWAALFWRESGFVVMNISDTCLPGWPNNASAALSMSSTDGFLQFSARFDDRTNRSTVCLSPSICTTIKLTPCPAGPQEAQTLWRPNGSANSSALAVVYNWSVIEDGTIPLVGPGSTTMASTTTTAKTTTTVSTQATTTIASTTSSSNVLQRIYT